MIEAQEVQSTMRQVAVDKIERELDNMWRETNANALASGSHPGTRNSVLSLVIYTGSEAEARSARQTVNAMAGMHPSRSIIVAPDGTNAPEPVRAFIGTAQYATGAGSSYGEQIVILAREDAVEHLPGVVLPLIISGLPSYLWWTHDPPWRSEQLEALVDGSDRFIVDTSEMTNGIQGLAALQDVQRRKRASCATSDFNWARLLPWRELIAGFFDGPSLHSYLQAIDRVTVEYAAGAEDSATNATAAYLFVGWLASRLNWNIQGGYRGSGTDAARQYTLYSAAGQPITIELNARYGVPIKSWREVVADEPGQDAAAQQAAAQQAAAQDGSKNGKNGTGDQTPSVGPGAMMSVYLHAQLNGKKVGTFAVAREPDMRHASTLSRAEGAPPSQTLYLPAVGESSLLATQLQMMSHDAIFEEALAVAAELLGPGKRG